MVKNSLSPTKIIETEEHRPEPDIGFTTRNEKPL